MQPERLLELAEELYLSRDEVRLRTASNRAYYCAHHALLPIVRILPEVQAPVSPGRIGHREVMRRLEAWSHPDHDIKRDLGHAARVTSKMLKNMIAAREHADYQLGHAYLPEHAEQQLRRSKDVLHFVQRVAKLAEEKAA